MINISFKDDGNMGYTIVSDTNILGHRYDNCANQIQITKPECETESVCIMIIRYKDKIISRTEIYEEPVDICDNVSRYNEVEIGFTFKRTDGYIKNTNIKKFEFLEAMKPDSVVSVEPTQTVDLDLLLAKAFIDVESLNEEEINVLRFINSNGKTVKEIKINGAGGSVDLSGKLDKQTPEFDSGATRGYVYYIDANGNQIVKKVQIQANADTIPLRNPNGTFYVGTATLPYECVNKNYVDNGFVPLKIKSLNNGVHAVYGIDGNTGEQMLFEIDSTGKKYYHLVRQKENGRVAVGDATADTDAVNLQTLKKTYATDEVGGVAKWVTGFGLKIDQYGRGQILQASNDEIIAKTQEYKPITPKNLNFAIIQGLTNNSITLTDEQKTAIKNWLGL